MNGDEENQQLAVAHEELRVADEELRAQHELIEQLIGGRAADEDAMSQLAYAVPVPLVDSDDAGVVTAANPAAGELLRLRTDYLAGKPIMSFVVAHDRGLVRSALSLALAGRRTQHLNAHVQPRRSASVLTDVAIVPAPVLAVAPDGARPATARPATARPATARPATARPVAARWVLAPHEAIGAAEPGVLEALAEMASLSVGTSDLRAALVRVAALAVRGVAGARSGSILVGHPSAPEILVTTGQQAQVGDGAQHRAEQGPVWDAYLAGAVSATTRLGQDERWPRLARVVGRSLGAALAVPLPAGEPEPAGVLALYGGEALAAVGGRADRAAMFAAGAAAVLREHKVVSDLRALERQLREALESRAVIDQAKGILMARLGCDSQEAFATLVRRSQSSNVKLRVIAAQLVAEVSSARSTD